MSLEGFNPNELIMHTADTTHTTYETKTLLYQHNCNFPHTQGRKDWGGGVCVEEVFMQKVNMDTLHLLQFVIEFVLYNPSTTANASSVQIFCWDAGKELSCCVANFNTPNDAVL